MSSVLLLTFTCCNCGESKPVQKTGGTGYGTDRETGAKTCFACIGIQDKQHLDSMKPGEKTYLYLSGDTVTNWPGTFSAPIHGMRISRHNFGIKRRDFWFWVNYKEFHGYQIGEDTQVAHIRRTNRVWIPTLHKFTKETVLPVFVITVKHETGKQRIKVTASDEAAARKMVCAAEGCPDGAIVKVRRLS